MKKVTSIMVAKEAGVSQSTVSLVVNNSPHVSGDTRLRVITAARKLGYVLEPQDRRLLVGVIISRYRLINSYQAMTLSALKDEIYKHGYRMEIICNEDIHLLNERVVSGAISISGDSSINEKWGELKNIPLIRFSSRGRHSSGIYTVFSDHVHGLRLMREHLRKAGHVNVGLFLRRTQAEEADLMEQTGRLYHEQLFMEGVQAPERLISYQADRRRDECIRERLKALLAQGVTALIVIPGDTALKVCRELRKLGLRIPEDISIISQEYDFVSEYWDPPLTVLHQDYPGMASAALSLLKLALTSKTGLQDIAVPGRLIVRASVRKINGTVS